MGTNDQDDQSGHPLTQEQPPRGLSLRTLESHVLQPRGQGGTDLPHQQLYPEATKGQSSSAASRGGNAKIQIHIFISCYHLSWK